MIITQGKIIQTFKRKPKRMYYLTSTNKFYDGQKFESLADAKEKADIISAKGFVVDVWALNDRETSRCIYTPANCVAGQATRAAYANN